MAIKYRAIKRAMEKAFPGELLRENIFSTVIYASNEERMTKLEQMAKNFVSDFGSECRDTTCPDELCLSCKEAVYAAGFKAAREMALKIADDPMERECGCRHLIKDMGDEPATPLPASKKVSP